MDYSSIPSKETIYKTIESLNSNGFSAEFFEDTEKAKERIFSLLPKGSPVMNMTSVTLDTLGISTHIQESGEYDALKNKLYSMDRKTQSQEMNELGSAPHYAIGSVHAITEDGTVMIASNSGSQLPAYSYGSQKVIWVVGAQKIVKNLDDGMKRIYEYTLPLESERAHKAYGVPGSFVSKLLIMNREPNPDRIHVIIINENLGY